MQYLAQFIDQQDLNHTFWCLNPDSGDTGGIVLSDWNTVDETKYNIVKQSLWKDGSGKFIGLDHQVYLGTGNTGTNVTEYYGGSVPTPVPTGTPTPVPTATPSPDPTDQPAETPAPTPGGLLGDVNSDGAIDIVDALVTAQYYVGLDPAGFDPSAADVNCDGSIDIVDALLIARYYVGLVKRGWEKFAGTKTIIRFWLYV